MNILILINTYFYNFSWFLNYLPLQIKLDVFWGEEKYFPIVLADSEDSPGGVELGYMDLMTNVLRAELLEVT